MSTVSVRYIVHDVDASIAFYCGNLGFRELMHPHPAFAMLSLGDLRLVIVAPLPAGERGGGSRPMPDGTRQEPGGWNRFMIEVEDLPARVAALRAAGVHLRSDIVVGVGGNQVIVDDPSGNPVELFQPTRQEARMSGPAATSQPDPAE
jgi:catechol 2,3-dioxygenase-like lactoylglutathione lyase family enzyme